MFFSGIRSSGGSGGRQRQSAGTAEADGRYNVIFYQPPAEGQPVSAVIADGTHPMIEQDSIGCTLYHIHTSNVIEPISEETSAATLCIEVIGGEGSAGHGIGGAPVMAYTSAAIISAYADVIVRAADKDRRSVNREAPAVYTASEVSLTGADASMYLNLRSAGKDHVDSGPTPRSVLIVSPIGFILLILGSLLHRGGGRKGRTTGGTPAPKLFFGRKAVPSV